MSNVSSIAAHHLSARGERAEKSRQEAQGRLSWGPAVHVVNTGATSPGAAVAATHRQPDAHRALAARRGAGEAAVMPNALPEIVHRARAMGISPQRLAKLAANALRKPRRAGSFGLAAAKFALACAEQDDDDEGHSRFIPYLVPIEGEVFDAEGLAQRLQDVENADDMARMLAWLLPEQDVLPRQPEALFEMLKSVRHDKHALMRLLARALGIQLPLKDRQQLKQDLQDQVRELELSREGALEASRFRASGVAAEQHDPALFLDTFEEIRAVETTTWVQQLQTLLKRHSITELPKALLGLVKAFGDELRVTYDDREKARLGAIMQELQKAHKERTFIERLYALADQVDRIRRLPALVEVATG